MGNEKQVAGSRTWTVRSVSRLEVSRTLYLPDLPMEFFDAGTKCGASFRQIGEVLLSRQKALIPPDLAFGFCDLSIGFAQPLFQSLYLGQERLPTGLRCHLRGNTSCPGTGRARTPARRH